MFSSILKSGKSLHRGECAPIACAFSFKFKVSCREKRKPKKSCFLKQLSKKLAQVIVYFPPVERFPRLSVSWLASQQP